MFISFLSLTWDPSSCANNNNNNNKRSEKKSVLCALQCLMKRTKQKPAPAFPSLAIRRFLPCSCNDRRVDKTTEKCVTKRIYNNNNKWGNALYIDPQHDRGKKWASIGPKSSHQFRSPRWSYPRCESSTFISFINFLFKLPAFLLYVEDWAGRSSSKARNPMRYRFFFFFALFALYGTYMGFYQLLAYLWWCWKHSIMEASFFNIKKRWDLGGDLIMPIRIGLLWG